ncbi:ATPase-like protein [Tricharina praecox]|uniref:ATPase-like protein n=1 Tax=Tricharina praecox TaxID=43433 RepID=UPI00221F359D|nr:ATPase-like protein [Tricharina praecox]KAI5858336.1 ATPase-like protein [Tricharina praecox]
MLVILLPSTVILAVAAFIFFERLHLRQILAIVRHRRNSDIEEKLLPRSSPGPSHQQTKPKPKSPLQQQVVAEKALYHALQNVGDHPESIPVARRRLLELLDHTVEQTLKAPETSILSVSEFSPKALKDFLQSAEDATSARFTAYLARRKSGGTREMFPDREYAEYWARQSAPVKYADGSWLGGIHRIDTAAHHRRWSKTGWQVLSEELGDGDLEKNHVFVYEKLVNSICDIGRGDEARFIDPCVNPNSDARVWTAAVSQLAISQCADEFLPEVLGFNMAYEALPYHLLVTIHEFRELRLDAYYFLLHVVIDNSDTGHAAMGREAVVGLVESARTPEEREELWRRVQAGFILAETLPTTPTPPSEATTRVLQIFKQKTVTAQPMHACCPAKVSGKTLSQWLDPAAYSSHSMDFLQGLADSRWIVRGNPSGSKLLRELKWGGRMFGAFTANEVEALEAWICELDDASYLVPSSTPNPSNAYKTFTRRRHHDRNRYFPPPQPVPVLPTPSTPPPHPPNHILDIPLPLPTPILHPRLPTLLTATAAPFEHLPAHSVKIATPHGMAAIKVLRALYGFLPETAYVAGMDEVVRSASASEGVVEIAQRLSGQDKNGGVPTPEEDPVASLVLQLSRSPERNWWELVGVQAALLALLKRRELWQTMGVADELQAIVGRCQNALRPVLMEEQADVARVWRGYCAVVQGLAGDQEDEDEDGEDEREESADMERV